MTARDNEQESATEAAEPHDDGLDPEQARIRALILARRNRFMAAAFAGAGMTLNGCWDSGDPNDATTADDAGNAAGGNGGMGGGTPCLGVEPCLSLEVCDNGSPPPCVCLEPPFDSGPADDSGTDNDAGQFDPFDPSVCLTPID